MLEPCLTLMIDVLGAQVSFLLPSCSSYLEFKSASWWKLSSMLVQGARMFVQTGGLVFQPQAIYEHHQHLSDPKWTRSLPPSSRIRTLLLYQLSKPGLTDMGVMLYKRDGVDDGIPNPPGDLMVIVNSALVAIAGVLTIARFWSRIAISRTVGLDDAFVLMALVSCHGRYSWMLLQLLTYCVSLIAHLDYHDRAVLRRFVGNHSFLSLWLIGCSEAKNGFGMHNVDVNQEHFLKAWKVSLSDLTIFQDKLTFTYSTFWHVKSFIRLLPALQKCQCCAFTSESFNHASFVLEPLWLCLLSLVLLLVPSFRLSFNADRLKKLGFQHYLVHAYILQPSGMPARPSMSPLIWWWSFFPSLKYHHWSYPRVKSGV